MFEGAQATETLMDSLKQRSIDKLKLSIENYDEWFHARPGYAEGRI